MCWISLDFFSITNELWWLILLHNLRDICEFYLVNLLAVPKEGSLLQTQMIQPRLPAESSPIVEIIQQIMDNV